jgi:hypothetical protein
MRVRWYTRISARRRGLGLSAARSRAPRYLGAPRRAFLAEAKRGRRVTFYIVWSPAARYSVTSPHPDVAPEDGEREEKVVMHACAVAFISA